ncbi:MAG: AGE family epimerase/isomerase [Prevotella sp.]|nr:AGE family epimerase/isomerase [Prevotella sp.]
MTTIETLKQEMREMLEDNILRYWMEKMVDAENGGFYARRDGNDHLDIEAPKSAVLNARILWAFSAAYRVLGKEEYLDMATRAYLFIKDHLIDKEYGGVYWSVDSHGEPLETKKHVYAMAVTLFALSEYLRATNSSEALELARGLLYNIEGRMADYINSGYTEALSRLWLPIKDSRLSDKDESMERSLNTHLHLLEAFTNLYRVWPNSVLAERIRILLGVLIEKMINPDTAHIGMFFTEEWQGGKEIRSYGHSIITAWILLDAARVLGNSFMIRQVAEKAVRMVNAADEGLRPNGGMIYMSIREGDQLRHIEDYHWWVEAENIFGHWYFYGFTGDDKYLSPVIQGLQFIKDHLIDRENGEWFWSWNEENGVNHTDDKAGIWKDPYHNTRMCLQIIEDLK